MRWQHGQTGSLRHRSQMPPLNDLTFKTLAKGFNIRARAGTEEVSPSKNEVLGVPVHNDSAVAISAPEPRMQCTAFPRENTPLEGAIALLSLSLIFGTVWAMPWFVLGVAYAILVLRSPWAVLLLALLLGDGLLLPAGRALLAAQSLCAMEESPAFRHSWLWDTWRRYFRLRLVTPPLPYLDPAKPALFAHFPHSTFPMGSWLSIALCDCPETGLPAGTQGAVASVLLALPLLKHIWAWMGCGPADYAPTKALLQHTSVGLAPEGVAGIFLGATQGQERIYARVRRGFIKLAMESGADIVPVYSLGQSQMLDFRGACGLSRRLRTAVGLFWGRWGLPIPRRHDIIVVIGRPVPVAAKQDPSPEEVDEAQAAVLAALALLFDQHKHIMPGWEDKRLDII